MLVDPAASLDGPFQDAVEIEHLDAIVITHAHADHSAGLPAVMAAFPTTPVLGTPSTIALLHALGRLPDSALARVRSLPFYERGVVTSSGNGLPWTICLLPAGHLLGAAMVMFDTPEGCVVCSGDVHLSNQYTVRRAARPRQRADVLVLESSYGNHEYRPRELEEARLIEQVRVAHARGGHSLIVAPPLGVAQEILMILLNARLQGQVPDATIWVDGMIERINSVFAQHAPSDHPRLARWIADHGNPFQPSSGLVETLPPRDHSAALSGPPAVIITSGSRILNGPSRYYARALASDERHLILVLAGQGAKQAVKDAVAPAAVECAVESFALLSHADGGALAALAARWCPQLVVINHGQPAVKAALQARVSAGGNEAVICDAGQTIVWPAPES